MDIAPYKNCKAHKQWLFVTNEEAPYRPCCYFKTDINADSVDDYYAKLSKLDIKHNCSYCINLEKQGNKYSPRKEVEETIPDDGLRITVAFDNVCNFKCTYCSPKYSTQIANEGDNIGNELYLAIIEQTPKKIKFIQEALEKTKYPKLQINILGGEPLINPKVFKFLDWLSKRPGAENVSVVILTNGAVFRKEIFEYSRLFDNLVLGFSIDGTGDVFELIRANGKWDSVKSIVDRYQALQDEKFHISFQYALSWMSVMGFPDWYNWLCQYDKFSYVHMNKVTYPETQSVDIIPPEGKKIVLDKVLDKLHPTTNPMFSDIKEKFIVQVLTGDDNSHLHDRAITEFERFDMLRKTDFKIVLSDVLEIMEKTRITSTIVNTRENHAN